MTIKTLARKGVPKRAIARQLDMTEGNVRYHLSRLEPGAVDGRSRQQHKAAELAEPVGFWFQDRQQCEAAINLAELHDWLVTDHGYGGSLRSIQRFVAVHFPPPRQRVRRRIETPPGAQAQIDWGSWPNMLIGGQRVDLQGFLLTLSHSRRPAVVWSYGQDQLSWLWCHNRAFERVGGIPAVLRVDNTKNAVPRGAGPQLQGQGRTTGPHRPGWVRHHPPALGVPRGVAGFYR